jgi:hypothetical protein
MPGAFPVDSEPVRRSVGSGQADLDLIAVFAEPQRVGPLRVHWQRELVFCHLLNLPPAPHRPDTLAGDSGSAPQEIAHCAFSD